MATTAKIAKDVKLLKAKLKKTPKLRFQWGSFVMDGEVHSISVDLDHFAALRAGRQLDQRADHVTRSPAVRCRRLGG